MEQENNNARKDEVFSKVVRAGKRTYFFDIKSTRNNDLYLTLTESKKTIYNGKTTYQKHKIFLYKEDFEKFTDGLTEVLNKIEALKSSGEYAVDESDSSYTSVDFDELK